MLLTTISVSDQAYGMMTLIACVIDLILSIIVIKKAAKHKESILYVFFLTLLFSSVSYWPTVFEYIYWVIAGNLLPYGFLSELSLIGTVISFLTWLYIYMKLVHVNKPKMLILILMIYGIISLVFFMYVLYYLHFAPGAPVKTMLGNEITPFISDAPDIILLYAFTILITILVTGLHFSIRSPAPLNSIR